MAVLPSNVQVRVGLTACCSCHAAGLLLLCPWLTARMVSDDVWFVGAKSRRAGILRAELAAFRSAKYAPYEN